MTNSRVTLFVDTKYVTHVYAQLLMPHKEQTKYTKQNVPHVVQNLYVLFSKTWVAITLETMIRQYAKNKHVKLPLQETPKTSILTPLKKQTYGKAAKIRMVVHYPVQNAA